MAKCKALTGSAVKGLTNMAPAFGSKQVANLLYFYVLHCWSHTCNTSHISCMFTLLFL